MLMSHIESHRSTGTSSGTAGGERSSGKRRILVVDDERDIVDLVRYNLNKNGYEALVATDGQQALQVAAKESPDLIILDLMLPGLHGTEVARRLKGMRGRAIFRS
jgi:DNA-binding response OmpR family regulator